jgi:hypothetical protein
MSLVQFLFGPQGLIGPKTTTVVLELQERSKNAETRFKTLDRIFL